MTDTEVQRELRRLRKAYRQQLPGELGRLRTLLAGARVAADEQQLEAACHLAHMLMGSSGTHGLTEVSAQLRRIEEHLNRMVEGGPEVSEGVWDEIEEALKAAGGVVDPPET